jgi:hypothetical protein
MCVSLKIFVQKPLPHYSQPSAACRMAHRRHRAFDIVYLHCQCQWPNMRYVRMQPGEVSVHRCGARENVAVLRVLVVLVPSPELALIPSTLTSCFCYQPIGKHGAGRGVGIPSVSTTIPQSASITDGGLPRPFPALVIQMLALTAHIRVRELPDGAEFLRITLVKV